MGSFIKKNWFVSLLIVVFACISIYVIYDNNKGKLKGKQSGGEDVVYSVGDQDVTVSAFYDDLYDQAGTNAVVTMFEKALVGQSVETTDEMKEFAETQKTSIESNYRNNYGTDYADYLAQDLASMGYTDLEDYLITYRKTQQIVSDYAKAHFDELKIRRISYILIQHETVETQTDEEGNVIETVHPTEDEQARMKAVDDAFAAGDDFATVAQNFSEDTSTASTGGVLGVIDTNTTTLDSAFQEAALALSEGEVSDWVHSDTFGYFKIRCDAATAESVEAAYTDSDPYDELTQNYDTVLRSKALWEKAEALGMDFKGNTELEEAIKNAYGMNEEAE